MSDNIIEIGDFNIERQRRWTLAAERECQHKKLVLEETGEIVRCRDCKAQVSAFWALCMLLDGFKRLKDDVNGRIKHYNEEMRKGVHTLAARAVEKAWRSKSMVPTCPHCNAGILPSDRFGSSLINKQIEMRRRQASS